MLNGVALIAELGTEVEMKTVNELLAIAEFLSDEMTDEQASRLMDEARQLSIADRERLLNALPGGPLYTELSMHNGEMGGLCRY